MREGDFRLDLSEPEASERKGFEKGRTDREWIGVERKTRYRFNRGRRGENRAPRLAGRCGLVGLRAPIFLLNHCAVATGIFARFGSSSS